MQSGHDEGDGLLSRSDLEIELARLVLAVDRRREALGPDMPADTAFASWFEVRAIDLLNQLTPDLRPFALERLQQIAESNGGLRITELEVDASTLTFAPDPDADGANSVPPGREATDTSEHPR